MMINKTVEAIEFLKTQDATIKYYKDKADNLETQLRRIKSFPKGYVLPNPLPEDMQENEYDIGQLNVAFQRTMDYEGLRGNHETILHTFFSFLNKTHHSLKDSDEK